MVLNMLTIYFIVKMNICLVKNKSIKMIQQLVLRIIYL